MTTGEDPSSCGARLARVGHSDSIITCAPLIESSACATRPSGPGRTFNSEAANVALQNSISAAASRHTSIAITGEIPVGIDFFISVLRLTRHKISDRETCKAVHKTRNVDGKHS